MFILFFFISAYVFVDLHIVEIASQFYSCLCQPFLLSNLIYAYKQTDILTVWLVFHVKHCNHAVFKQ